MPRHDPLSAWTLELRTAFPHLSQPQLQGLAHWSFGMILARSCSLSLVTSYLADWLEQPEFSVHNRLREWYLPADLKAGHQRRDLDVTTCFAPLLRWLRRDWPEPRLPLALDASPLGARFVLLAISVLYRSCAVPVAWNILPANTPGAWSPYWRNLLEALRGVVPPDWLAVMLADRGLWAKWLFEKIQNLGWHPLMRITRSGHFCPEGGQAFVPLKQLVSQTGAWWRGRGLAFATPQRQLAATLLGWWGRGHKDPWLLLTDLAPEQSHVAWYSLRNWIEQGFKDSKSGGWQWQYTRMADPQRAERLWLAIAVATLWLLRVGGSAEEATEAGRGRDQACHRHGRCWRMNSVFARGHRVIQMALVKHRRLPLGVWCPESWPKFTLS